MKTKKIISALSGLLMLVGLAGCEDEKKLIIIDGDLPIKTSSLYMVGDATPNGWNIDSPTPLTATDEDPLVFTWEGPLNVGEMKLCLATGSWDNPFIRPMTAGEEINKSGLTDVAFKMHAGDPDDKWKVEEPGIYRLTFDLSNWTIAAEYTGDYKPAASLFMIGTATAGGWSWDAATVIEASADNDKLFVWEGELGRGTFKASLVKDFGAPFYRPTKADCEVSDKGVASNQMVFTESPDDQWLVTVAGKYRLTFNTADMTFDAKFLETGPEKLPSLYMIGTATAGGWSLDAATEIAAAAENLYVWEGELKEGTFKASLVKDFGAPFYRPTKADCEVSENGVADPGMVFTTEPDDQWKVVKAGKYRLTFNTADMTFDAKYLVSSEKPLYILGDATPGGWSQDDAAQLTPVDGKEGEYTWTGTLKKGHMKAFSDKDPNWGQNFYRPSKADVEISKSGVAASDMVFTNAPDDQWQIVDEGAYQLTLDIKAMTIRAKFLN